MTQDGIQDGTGLREILSGLGTLLLSRVSLLLASLDCIASVERDLELETSGHRNKVRIYLTRVTLTRRHV